jgi:uncharacterized alpha-E superfamily protein
MHRYLERADCMARLLEVSHVFELDGDVASGAARWRPILVVAGEEPRFLELHGELAAEDGEWVQSYLCWDAACVTSIESSWRWARENARTIRDALSLEVWEAINDVWLWLSAGKGRRKYKAARGEFYARIKDGALLVRGATRDTVLHDEAFDFMRLGLLCERANQTARLLDVWHHTLEFGGHEASAFAQVVAVLRSCSAADAYMKRGVALSGPGVARFLSLDEEFPRSVLHCLRQAAQVLDRLTAQSGRAEALSASAHLLEILERMQSAQFVASLDGGLHEELTWLVDHIAMVCGAVHSDFFDPRHLEAAR